MAMTLITTQTVSSSGLNVWTLGSIPQTYSTLLIKALLSDSTASTGRNDFYITFNSDTNTGTNYYAHRMLFYDGSNKLGGFGTDSGNGHAMPGSGNGPRFGSYEYIIPNYTSTSTNKSIHAQGGMAASTSQAFINNVTYVNMNNTQAVGSVTFKAAGSGQFAINSTISIYGLD